ncbi:acyl transferase [Aequorivita sp. H23M31]|uniref:Acyl transferase n=1 Tax=Aequorivita ciconiae TaxID=2494375 RepID=A0A410G3G9_9FLAO|nr:acyl transferase [Aequorivita sp. H23M31]QAA81822.1 acyl transferase [Aequorivita sp. H23M31]
MLSDEIFNIDCPKEFLRLAIEIFHFQYENVEVYRTFCDLLKCEPKKVKTLESIPFLPIQFFKSHQIIAQGRNPEIIFTSSGTTGTITSKHLVADVKIYEESFLKGFIREYGNINEFAILALLPSYLEREGSSLIYMVESLIEKSENPYSGFYLYEMDELVKKLDFLQQKKQKTLLIGVSYALLDLIENRRMKLKNTIVMETGGMKGKRKEMIKQELHQVLKAGFGVQDIHSEYGMTELLSQAYSKGNCTFSCPPWMKILTRDPEDPKTYIHGKTGGINIIDLANIYSCSFIATQDLGRTDPHGDFEVMGRFDASDIRGCNLMVL